MYKIDIKGLTKYYGETLVLEDINLQVKEHEVISLIGASGSGKSTLLRCINDLTPFDYGEVLIDGVSIHDESIKPGDLHKRIGIVFQSYNLFPHMNVLDNITLSPTKVHKRGKAEAENHAHELLRLFDLADFAHSYPEQLSGGQQQRVAIIRAMANKPDVLLLDEITAALDPELIAEVLSIIKSLRDQGMTMIIVTHEMSFARDVSDRVCFLDGGGIYEEGSGQDLFTNPQRDRTKQFLQRIIAAGRL
jgi:polar amino acid transport system ATP-binding protein